MRVYNYLIKPASGACNMRCRYCFYQDLTQLREQKDLGLMQEETAMAFIRRAFEVAVVDDVINFAFQGGEPTLAGLSFFENFVKMVDSYNTKEVPVSFALQTNGLALDEEWADFLFDKKFLVGISIDGNRLTHDLNRIDAKGNGTFSRVKKNIRLLQQKKVALNALCVVTSSTDALSSYQNLKSLGFKFIQFIPCLDPIEEERGKREFSLTVALYTKFLCEAFDLWYEDWRSGNYVSVRLFDDYVHLVEGMEPTSCSVLGRCGTYLVIEADGSIYPCDFYVMDKYKLGNVLDENTDFFKGATYSNGQPVKAKGIQTYFWHPVMRDFINSNDQKPPLCEQCMFYALCMGGCQRDRDFCGQIKTNYFCPTFKTFFTYAFERLQEIAKAEKDYKRQFD